jgi:hypothetical protein
MNVSYTEKARQSGEGYALLEQATKRLEEVLGEEASRVSAEWDRTEDEKGQPLYALTLRDASDKVTGRLAPDELLSPPSTRFRLRRLWGDLLHARTENYFRGLRDSEE